MFALIATWNRVMSTDKQQIQALFELPFNDLIFRAQTVHREYFDPNQVQMSTLLSIKTGGCSEDCGYCSQSARYQTDLEKEKLLPLEEVLAAAQQAKDNGASRFCMGAAWRGPKAKDLDQVAEMIRGVKSLGLETCVTLGMLQEGQAKTLKAVGLDYYNHNIDTAPEHYANVITTHGIEDRLDTLNKVRQAGIKVCCGGIMGMGETRENRVSFIAALSALDPAPESVPINLLVKIPGTPLADSPALDPIEFVRTIAVTRIVLPTSLVRLSAGRQQMPDHLQALCFLAGANSIFYGERLLTTGNPEANSDQTLMKTLGIEAMPLTASPQKAQCSELQLRNH